MDVTEIFSFQDPDVIYGPDDVDGVIVDLEVDYTHLKATYSDGTTHIVGDWAAIPPANLETVEWNQDSLVFGISNGVEKTIAKAKDHTLESGDVLGTGFDKDVSLFGTFTSVTPDWYDEDAGLMYTVDAEPENLVVYSNISIEADGVVAVATNSYGSGYTIANAINRDLVGFGCGLLAKNSSAWSMTMMYPSPILLKAFLWAGIRTDAWATSSINFEYTSDGTNWIHVIALYFPGAECKQERTHVLDVPVSAMGIRASKPSGYGYGQVGTFAGLIEASGAVVGHSPIDFDPAEVEVVENDTALLVKVKTEIELENPAPVEIQQYTRLLRRATQLPVGTSQGYKEMIGFDMVDVDRIGIDFSHDGMFELPAGKYKLSYLYRTESTQPKASCYLGDANGDVLTNPQPINSNIGEVGTMYAEVNLSVPTWVGIFTAGKATATANTPANGDLLDSLELWRLGESE